MPEHNGPVPHNAEQQITPRKVPLKDRIIQRFRRQEPRQVFENLAKEVESDPILDPRLETEVPVTLDLTVSAHDQYRRLAESVGPFDVKKEYRALKADTDRRAADNNSQRKSERVFGAGDKLRHKTLETMARTQGVKDINEFNELVKQLERTLTDTEYEHEYFRTEPSDADKERILQKWRDKGYQAHSSDFRPAYDDSGRCHLMISREVFRNIQSKDITVLKKIIESGSKPTAAVKVLQEAGFRIDPRYMSEEGLEMIQSMVGLLGDEKNMEFMREYVRLPVDRFVGLSEYSLTHQGSKEVIESLITHFQNGDVEKYTPEIFEKINVVTREMGMHASILYLDKLRDIVTTPEKFDFVVTALSKGIVRTSHKEFIGGQIIDNLDAAGLLKPFTEYLQANLAADNLRYEINVANIGELLENPDVKDILQSPQKKEFARLAAFISGKNLDAVAVKKLFPQREDLVRAYNVLSQNNLLSDVRDDRQLEFISDMFEYSQAKASLTDPNFSIFLKEANAEGVVFPSLQRWRSDPRADLVFRVYDVKDVADFAGEDLLVIAKQAINGDSETKRAAENKIALFNIAKPDLELFKKIDSLNFVPRDAILQYDNMVRIQKLPFLQEAVRGKLPPELQDEWIKDALIVPEALQDEILRESGVIRYVDGKYDVKDMHVSQENLKKIHNVADFMRGVFEKKMFVDNPLGVVAVGTIVVNAPSLLAQREEAISFLRQAVEQSGDNIAPLLKEYEGYINKNAGHRIDFSKISGYLQKFDEPQNSKDQALRRGYKMFGDHITLDSYLTVQSILDGSISSEMMQKIGITQTGQEGIAQLEGAMRNFVFNLTSNKLDYNMFKNEMIASFFKSYIRYETASWGSHTDENFTRLIDTLQNLEAEGVDLGSGGLPSSGIQEITKLQRSHEEESPFTESFLSRYATLTGNIKEALQLIEQPRAFSTIGKSIEVKRDELVEALASDLEKNKDNPKAQAHIQKRIDSLKAVNPADLKSFQSNFATLAREREFQDLLMQGVFAYSLQKFPEQRERMREALMKEIPDIDSITAVIDFTGHMTTKEAWSSYFTDKNARKAFQNMLDLKEVEDGLSRLSGLDRKSNAKSVVEFVPTRGVLMEFSGYIGDACWASKYSSIAEQFPNITSIAMQDVSKEIPVLLGSSLLIETTATDGTPLMIIRGLNPQQSYINHVDVSDFYTKYTEYIKKLAEIKGRKAAIVIDNHSGGASTNRPLLFSYLDQKRSELTAIPVGTDDTTFNGYNISNYTYLLN